MKILQFKRGQITNQNPTLKDGEIYIDNKNKYVRVGTSTAPNGGPEGFNIKSKPVFGVDIVNQGGNVIPRAVQDFTITNGTGGNSVFNITYVDGSTASREVTLSGSVASANYATSAGTASKLSTQKKGANTTNAVQPIWWNNYLPEALTASSGTANNPVYVDKGVIKPITGIDRPNIRATNSLGLPYIQTEGALLAVTGQQGEIGASHGCGDSSHPIYITPQGIPALCSSLNAQTANQLNYQGATNKTIKADGTTTCISLNMQAGRWHLVNGRYNHNSKILTYSFLIYISSVSSNTAPDYDFSTNCIGGSGTFYDMMLVRAGDKLWCQRSGSVITTTSQHYELTNVICTRL